MFVLSMSWHSNNYLFYLITILLMCSGKPKSTIWGERLWALISLGISTMRTWTLNMVSSFLYPNLPFLCAVQFLLTIELIFGLFLPLCKTRHVNSLQWIVDTSPCTISSFLVRFKGFSSPKKLELIIIDLT